MFLRRVHLHQWNGGKRYRNTRDAMQKFPRIKTIYLPLLLHSNEVNQSIKLILYLREIIRFSEDHLTASWPATHWVLDFRHNELCCQPQKVWGDVCLCQNTCSKLEIYCNGTGPANHIPSQAHHIRSSNTTFPCMVNSLAGQVHSCTHFEM